jgi:hypothetical protein
MRTALTARRICAALLLSTTLAIAGESGERIVAIGDIHGAFEEFVTIMERTGLIDANRNWAGGQTLFVQTGDVLDRGPAARASLDLIMELQRESKKQNGKVIPLLGNHETMNMMHDLRYVSAEGYKAFATDQSEKIRENNYRQYRKFLAGHAGHQHTAPPDNEAARQQWMSEHPLGFFEYCDAFGPRGEYGKWLRAHDAVVQIGDVLFIHGGLNPKLHIRSVDDLNDRVHSEIAKFDSIWELLVTRSIIWRYMTFQEALRQVQEEWTVVQTRGQIEDPEAAQAMRAFLTLQNWLTVSPDGPLWYRGLALEPEEKLKSDLVAMLKHLKVKYIVAGHTVRPKFDLMPRFDGHVYLIDTGMLKQAYGGRASALEIKDGRFTAYYSDSQPQVLDPPPTEGQLGQGGEVGRTEPKP